ncbi:MAG TPA: Gmad2 immunoglobulin-like domain-containing protein [Acidimicrobiia bacterium]
MTAAALATACSSGAGSAPKARGGHPPTTATASTAPRTQPQAGSAPTTTAGAGAHEVLVYLVHGAGLTIVSSNVQVADADHAIQALLAGPTAADRALGDTTTIPAGTTVRSVQISGDTATVDLSAPFTSGAPLASVLRDRVAQVVYTATQFAGISRVAFAIDGTAARTIGPTNFQVDPPLSRLDLTAALDTVLTDAPAPGDIVTSPMTVRGMGDTFEAQVSLRLRDANGHVLADTSTQATSGNGVWGTFSAEISFAKPSTASGTLEVFDASEGDGAGAHGQTIPIRFK